MMMSSIAVRKCFGSALGRVIYPSPRVLVVSDDRVRVHQVLILFEVLDRATTLSLRKRRRTIQNTQVGPPLHITHSVYQQALCLRLRQAHTDTCPSTNLLQVAWAFLRPLSLKGQAMVPLSPPSSSEPAAPFKLQLYEYQYLGPLATVQAHFRDMGRASWGLSQEGKANRVPPVYLQVLLLVPSYP